MKKFIILLLLSTCTLGFCQGTTFIINNKQIVWQKVFNSEKSLSEIEKIISSNGKLKIDKNGDDYFSGEIHDFTMDYKGAGNTYMGTPIYLNENNKYTASFNLEYKEGKYRVTISNIKLKGLQMTTLNEGFGLSNDGIEYLESYALTNDKEKIRSRFQGRESKIIDWSFTQLFDITKYKINDDSW